MNAEINKILVAYDFSEGSEAVLNVASSIAQRQNAELLLCYILEGGLGDVKFNADVLIQKKLFADQLAELGRSLVERTGLKVNTIVDHGFVALELCLLSEKNSVDLLVIGQHGKGGSKPLFAGSNVMSIVRKSEVPVLIIPNNVSKYAFEHILFPIRPIEEQSVKINITMPLVRKNKSMIHLLGLTENRNLEQLNLMETAFENAFSKIQTEGIMFSYEKTTCDDLASKVLETVKEKNFDLIVLDNSYKSNGLLFSYYVHKIVNNVNIPLLIVDPL